MTEKELAQIFGANLKRLRLKKDMLQREVAAELGITDDAYRNNEKGNYLPSNKRIVQYINYYDVAPMELFR